MPSIQRFASRDDVRSMVVKFEADGPEGKDKVEIQVKYYRNRITMAPVNLKLPEDVDVDALTDDEFDALKSASRLCHYVHSWDLEGALYDGSGNEVVAEGQPIPLDPRVTQHIPTVTSNEFIDKLVEHVFPNVKQSRNERRRSR